MRLMRGASAFDILGHRRTSRNALVSHLPKAMRERAAHRERLGTRLEAYRRAAGEIARGRHNMRQVDDRAAVDLPESRGVELLGKLLERGSDHRFTFARKYAR